MIYELLRHGLSLFISMSHTIYFDHTFSSPNFSQILSLPYLPARLCSLSKTQKKVRIKNKQKSQTITKSSQKMSRFSLLLFVGCCCCWCCMCVCACWPAVGDHLSDTVLEKTHFASASGYRLQIATWLGEGPYVYFLLGAGTKCSDSCPCSCVCYHSAVSSYMQPCSGIHWFTGATHRVW